MSAPNLSGGSGVQALEESDERLVARARGGEVEAFGALVERHQRRVGGMLLSLLRDPAAAADYGPRRDPLRLRPARGGGGPARPAWLPRKVC